MKSNLNIIAIGTMSPKLITNLLRCRNWSTSGCRQESLKLPVV